MEWQPEIVDPERRLALAYAPREWRRALALLWALDERLGAIVAATREPMLGEIRLAWWRDRLAAIDIRALAGEPLLEGLEPIARLCRLSPNELARLPQGWMALLGALPLERGALLAHGDERGGVLFRLSARLLGMDHAAAADAGAAWALLDIAARFRDPSTVTLARALAAEKLGNVQGTSWPRPLRPLAVLMALARLDSRAGSRRRQGSPRRLATALWAGVTGR